MRLVAKGDATAGNGELTVSAGDAAAAKGSAHWQPSGAATAVSVRLEAAGKELPYAGPFSLSAEATVDGKTATLSSSKLTAGPLGLAAVGPLRSRGRPARRHGDRASRRARAARADRWEASTGATCNLRRTPCWIIWRSSRRAR